MMAKRLVLDYNDTMVIFGRTDDDVQPETLLNLPAFGPINLVAAKRTYYLYRPVMVPQTTSEYNPRTFNPAGGTTVFNSGQR